MIHELGIGKKEGRERGRKEMGEVGRNKKERKRGRKDGIKEGREGDKEDI